MGNRGASQEADAWTASQAVRLTPGGVGGVTLHTEGQAETQRRTHVGWDSRPKGTRLTGFDVFSPPHLWILERRRSESAQEFRV